MQQDFRTRRKAPPTKHPAALRLAGWPACSRVRCALLLQVWVNQTSGQTSSSHPVTGVSLEKKKEKITFEPKADFPPTCLFAYSTQAQLPSVAESGPQDHPSRTSEGAGPTL